MSDLPHVYVTGSPRSGTTLMQALLHSFKGLWGKQTESYLPPEVFPGEIVKKPFRVAGDRTEIVDAIATDYKVIVMLRDGRDVMTSRHPLFPDKWYVEDPYRWIRSVECHRKFTQNTNQVTVVRYEDLVTDPTATIDAVAKFLSLPVPSDFLSALRDVPVSSRAFDTGLRGQLYIVDSHIGQWQLHKHRIVELMMDKRWTTRMCKLLVELEYEKDNKWVRTLETE